MLVGVSSSTAIHLLVDSDHLKRPSRNCRQIGAVADPMFSVYVRRVVLGFAARSEGAEGSEGADPIEDNSL